MKRTRTTRDRLTGGTNDVNPQLIHTPFLTIPQTAGTAVSKAEIIINLPINRLTSRAGHAIIVEILKVYWDFNAPTGAVTAGFVTQSAKACLATKSQASNTQINGADPSVLCAMGWNIRWSQPATTDAAAAAFIDPMETDLTDGAGHGLLVAVDKLYFIGHTINQDSTGTAYLVCAKILYRFKEVALEEYIGIVQSQQQST